MLGLVIKPLPYFCKKYRVEKITKQVFFTCIGDLNHTVIFRKNTGLGVAIKVYN
jgi:hypothetical protein